MYDNEMKCFDFVKEKYKFDQRSVTTVVERMKLYKFDQSSVKTVQLVLEKRKLFSCSNVNDFQEQTNSYCHILFNLIYKLENGKLPSCLIYKLEKLVQPQETVNCSFHCLSYSYLYYLPVKSKHFCVLVLTYKQ